MSESLNHPLNQFVKLFLFLVFKLAHKKGETAEGFVHLKDLLKNLNTATSYFFEIVVLL